MPGITRAIHKLERDFSLSTVKMEILILTDLIDQSKPRKTISWIDWFLYRGDKNAS
jgi:hypothetical protein